MYNGYKALHFTTRYSKIVDISLAVGVKMSRSIYQCCATLTKINGNIGANVCISHECGWTCYTKADESAG